MGQEAVRFELVVMVVVSGGYGGKGEHTAPHSVQRSAQPRNNDDPQASPPLSLTPSGPEPLSLEVQALCSELRLEGCMAGAPLLLFRRVAHQH